MESLFIFFQLLHHFESHFESKCGHTFILYSLHFRQIITNYLDLSFAAISLLKNVFFWVFKKRLQKVEKMLLQKS